MVKGQWLLETAKYLLKFLLHGEDSKPKRRSIVENRPLTTVELRICHGDTEALDFSPTYGTRSRRGRFCIALPRTAGVCQHGVFCVHRDHVLGLGPGGDSSHWSARLPAGLSSICNYPFPFV